MSTAKPIDFFYPDKFEFVLQRCPNVAFQLSTVNIPSISLSVAEATTPYKSMKFAGDSYTNEPLDILFKLNSDFSNYIEIYNWLEEIGNPYEANPNYHDSTYSTGSLIIKSSNSVKNLEIQFDKMFPINLGTLQLALNNASNEILTCSTTFEFATSKIILDK